MQKEHGIPVKLLAHCSNDHGASDKSKTNTEKMENQWKNAVENYITISRDICKHGNGGEISSKSKNKCKVDVLPFPSAQAGCMKGYLKPLREDPDIFVWCIGI